jgi:hypothetical protein
MLAGASAGTNADKQHLAKFALFSVAQAGNLVWTLWVASKVGLVSEKMHAFTHLGCI